MLCFLDFEMYKSLDVVSIVINVDVDVWVLLQPEDNIDVVSTGYEDLDKLSRSFQQKIQRTEQFMPFVRTTFI